MWSWRLRRWLLVLWRLWWLRWIWIWRVAAWQFMRSRYTQIIFLRCHLL